MAEWPITPEQWAAPPPEGHWERLAREAKEAREAWEVAATPYLPWAKALARRERYIDIRDEPGDELDWADVIRMVVDLLRDNRWTVTPPGEPDA